MKLGLYSITYLGVWYRGDALTLEQVIDRAREYGYDGVEIDGKRPHGNPLDLPAARRLDLRRRAEAAGVEIYAVAANNDFSSPVPEHREAQLAYINDLIRMTADLGAPDPSHVRRVARRHLRALCVLRGHDSASSAAVGRYDVARRIWAAAHEGVPKEQTWAWCRDGLIESARRAADQGVMLALQNHPPVVDNGDDMLRMVREVGSPALQACFDAPLARRQGVVDMRAALLTSDRVRCCRISAASTTGRRWSGARLRAGARRQPDPRIVLCRVRPRPGGDRIRRLHRVRALPPAAGGRRPDGRNRVRRHERASRRRIHARGFERRQNAGGQSRRDRSKRRDSPFVPGPACAAIEMSYAEPDFHGTSRFEIRRHLGTGGMGAVYQATIATARRTWHSRPSSVRIQPRSTSSSASSAILPTSPIRTW